jgi:hypothetical protein
MHEPVRDQLENILGNGGLEDSQSRLAASALPHLEQCLECASEVKAMTTVAAQLRLLKPESELDPAAGFYARVMQRIEQRAKLSEWSAFLYSPFSKRLAYGSLSAALVLGLYLFTAESQDGHLGSGNPSQQQAAKVMAGNQDEQRDAVLVNLAVFEGSPQ